MIASCMAVSAGFIQWRRLWLMSACTAFSSAGSHLDPGSRVKDCMPNIQAGPANSAACFTTGRTYRQPGRALFVTRNSRPQSTDNALQLQPQGPTVEQ